MIIKAVSAVWERYSSDEEANLGRQGDSKLRIGEADLPAKGENHPWWVCDS